MKKLFIAAAIALLVPFSTVLYAADEQKNQGELEKNSRQLEARAEQDSKNELKELIGGDILKKDLEAAREQQKGNKQGAPPEAQKAEQKKTAD